MRYVAHDYQKKCIDFILKNPIAMIWLSCGMGKTSITLTALEALMFDYFSIHKTLVIQV